MTETLKKQIIDSYKPVGVKKSSDWNLPPKDFAYGYKVKEDPENASIITRSWIEHKPSKPIEAKTDFIKVNKLAVEKKIIDPKANKEFRKTVNIKQDVPKGKKREKFQSSSNTNIVYGKRNRTPTPVKEVINNDFGNKHEVELMKNYEKIISDKVNLNEKNETLNTKSDVKVSMKKKKDQETKSSSVLKSKKFNDVQSKVKENINNFKTSSKNKNLDDLINKVEKEIKQLESEKEKN